MIFLADINEFYKVADGMYDFDLVSLVVRWLHSARAHVHARACICVLCMCACALVSTIYLVPSQKTMVRHKLGVRGAQLQTGRQVGEMSLLYREQMGTL